MTDVTLVSDARSTGDAWQRLSALADGVKFTRELVAEPANILYPESFVERCQPLRDLGIEITVLDETQMAELGMGALLGFRKDHRASRACRRFAGTALAAGRRRRLSLSARDR